MKHYVPTSDEWYQHTIISSLQNLQNPDTMDSEQVAIIDMLSKKKKKLVKDIYKKTHPRAKEGFYVCSNGLIRSRNPDFNAKNEDLLLEKLYDYYFMRTMKPEFEKWILKRSRKKKVSPKTISSDVDYWHRVLSKEEIANTPMQNITPQNIQDLFESWTQNGEITHKEFMSRKCLLNGIFQQAVLDEVISVNPIPSLSTRDLIFKAPKPTDPYTAEERVKMLEYLQGLKEKDAYTLAIQLAFYGVFRVGEIKALRRSSVGDKLLWISSQIVDEPEITIHDDQVHVGKTVKKEKRPKGSPEFAIHPNVLTPTIAEIIAAASKLNPDGEYIFMHKGNTLTTSTFNRRLKLYTTAIGIPYRSSHKIRFTNASLLAQEGGMNLKDLSRIMGHSNTQTTAHYAQQTIKPLATSIVEKTLC